MKDKICMGSRESRLAVIQTELVRDAVKERFPEKEISILTMKTTGDRILDKSLDKIGGERSFCKGAGPGSDPGDHRSVRTQPEGCSHGAPRSASFGGFF